MRRMISAAALAALLLAASLTPSLAHGRAHAAHTRQPTHGMCVRGVQGACNPGLPGWGSGGSSSGEVWRCHPVMPTSAAGHPRSHAWVCAWVPTGAGR